jgi:hypothetical protein
MSEGRPPRGPIALLAAAWAVNLAFDGVGWLVPGIAPPHLLLRYAPEFVQQMVTPGIMGPIASAVLAGIAVLLVGVVPPAAPRRALALSAWILGFFVFAEGLLALVWLDAPWPLVLGGLAFGAVRSGAAGWLLARLSAGGAATAAAGGAGTAAP